MRRPLLPSKLIPAADTVARLVAKTVLIDPDREDAEQLILLALWLERVASWKTDQDAKRRAKSTRDRNCP